MSKNIRKNFKAEIKLVTKHNEKVRKYEKEESITTHYEIREYLSKMMEKDECTEEDITILANQISTRCSAFKEFHNKDSFYKAIKFYETYHNDKVLMSLKNGTTWQNNLIILELDVPIYEKEFYLIMCNNNGLNLTGLSSIIKANYYQYFLSNLEKMKMK